MNEPGERLSNAEILRRILAGLRDEGPLPQVAGVLALPPERATRRGRGGRGVRGGLPAPPNWATHSVIEDGGVTHERVSAAHPLVWLDRADVGAAGEHACPTDVSLSVVDRPGAVRWGRLPPTIQIEGGSYSVAEARRLIRAVEELIAALAG